MGRKIILASSLARQLIWQVEISTKGFSMYLQSTKSKYRDPNVPVDRVGDSLGQVSEMNTGCPASHSDSIPNHLARYMKIEPCRIG
jgi:hypothetical protein